MANWLTSGAILRQIINPQVLILIHSEDIFLVLEWSPVLQDSFFGCVRS